MPCLGRGKHLLPLTIPGSTAPVRIAGFAEGKKTMKTIITIALLLASSLALAHSGGTNKQGCHTNHKTGDYHCH